MKTHLDILLIEDAPADAYRLNHEFQQAGLAYRVRRVETREAFLEALQQGRPDVILSDHGLPKFDGFTALHLVQKQHLKVPFIFVTGANDQAMLLEMFDGGAAGYVSKNRIKELVPTLLQVLATAEEPWQPPLLVDQPAPPAEADYPKRVSLTKK